MTFQVKHGSYSYGKETILNDVNFSVSSGEILCVLGSNGVGKTTLLKCMMGLLRWKNGASFLDEKNISEIPEKEFWKKISYVPQAKNSTFSFSALDMVVMGRSTRLGAFEMPTKEDEAAALRAMDVCGILFLKDKLCNKMSGGELQMVLIARALASNPEMLVFDEPESNLDFKNQLVILNLIEKLAGEKKIATIVNTHFPSHAMKIAHHALILNRNEKIIFGKCNTVISEENMRKAFKVQACINEFYFQGKRYRSVYPLYVVS